MSASSHHEAQNLDRIRTIYRTSFAPALDRLLETRWFSMHGFMSLASDRSLLSQFEHYIATIPHASNIGNQEARLIWALLSMCRRRPGESIADLVNGPADNFDGDEIASKRLRIVEALITGCHLDVNPITPNINTCEDQPCALIQQLMSREREFWFHVGQFASASPKANPEASRTMCVREEESLHRCRALLDRLENRDLLYSVMLMRHIGDRNFNAIPDAVQIDLWKNWTTASSFLLLGSQGQANSLVTRRFSAMALGPWTIDVDSE